MEQKWASIKMSHRFVDRTLVRSLLSQKTKVRRVLNLELIEYAFGIGSEALGRRENLRVFHILLQASVTAIKF